VFSGLAYPDYIASATTNLGKNAAAYLSMQDYAVVLHIIMPAAAWRGTTAAFTKRNTTGYLKASVGIIVMNSIHLMASGYGSRSTCSTTEPLVIG
jgi:hypothetical protein